MDDSVIIGTRDIKMALRRLRKFARQGNDLELDMDDTIKSTAKNAGYLDICLLYTSPSPRDRQKSRMPSSA